LTAKAMREYFARRYSPGNIVLAGAGRIDFDAIVATANRCCGHWQPGATMRLVEPTAGRDGFHVLHHKSATQQYTLQLSPGPAAEDDDRYAAKLLATVLGDDSGSRLFWELVDPGLAEQASISHSEHEGAGLMMTYLCCEPEQVADNLQRIHNVYQKAEREGIELTELNQAKNKFRSRIVLSGERPRGRLFAIGSEWVYRRAYRSIEADLNTVAAVTVDDLVGVLAKYPLTRPTTVTIGPLPDVPRPS
jgi:predicted Zn-dependent peptidase